MVLSSSLSKLAMVSSLNIDAIPEGLRIVSDPLANSNLVDSLSIESQFGFASLRILKSEKGKIEIAHSGKGFAIILQNNKRIVKASFVYPDENFLVTNTPFEIPPSAGSVQSIKLYDHFLLGVPLQDDIVFDNSSFQASTLLAAIINDRSKKSEMGRQYDNIVNLCRLHERNICKSLLKGKYFLIVGRFLQSEATKDNDSLSGQMSVINTEESRSETNLTFQPHCPILLPFLELISTVSCKLITSTWNRNDMAVVKSESKKLVVLTKHSISGASVQLKYEKGQNRLVYEQTGLANVLVIRPLLD